MMGDGFQDAPETAGIGRHLLVDLWGASGLRDAARIEQALRRAAEAAEAQVLDVRLHAFGAAGGVTGVALLAESHISIHTWPEHGYAAVDVFVCGACAPRAAVPVLEAAFAPVRLRCTEHQRGTRPAAAVEKAVDIDAYAS